MTSSWKSPITSGDEEKTTVFTEYFSNVFTRETRGEIPHLAMKVMSETMRKLKMEVNDIV